jgi:transcriptional regulator with XRE-family HTH domain
MRTQLSLSQAQLAALLGVHSLTVSKWERGLLRPTQHQEALMTTFAKARSANAAVGEEAKKALIAAGVIVALFILLSAAVNDK